MLNSRKPSILFLAAAAILAVGSSARADFRVEYGVGGNMTTVVDNGAGDLDPTVGTIFISRTVDQVVFAIAANSNRTTPESNSQVQDATVNIQNIASSSQNVRIAITDTGFTFPMAGGDPVILQSRLGISSIGGTNTALTGTFQSFADNNNTPFGTEISTSPQNMSFPLPLSEQIRETVFIRADEYSLSNVFLITLPANQENGASFTGTTRVLPTPVPGNVVLLGTAMPLIGLCLWAAGRRRPAAMA